MVKLALIIDTNTKPVVRNLMAKLIFEKEACRNSVYCRYSGASMFHTRGAIQFVEDVFVLSDLGHKK